MNNSERTILYLLSRALFGANNTLEQPVDWVNLYKEASVQTVHALTYNALTEDELSQMPEQLMENWQTLFFQSIFNNEQVMYEQSQIIKSLSDKNIPFVILKGKGSAINYPEPNLRAFGDIDLLTSEADINLVSETLKEQGYIEMSESALHITLSKENIFVELHRKPFSLDFNENEQIEKSINEFFADIFQTCQTVDGVPIPSDLHQAIILLIHKLTHFLGGELGLRQLCDWAVFVQKRVNDDLWAKLSPLLDEFGIKTFTLVITKVCVDYLGLPITCAEWAKDCDSELVNSVIELIVESGNFGAKVDNYYGQRLFVDAHSKNRVTSFFKVLGSACRNNWPPCKKHPILMPIAPLVIYCKYLKMRIQGKRKKLKLTTQYKRAGTRQKLYQELKPFIRIEEDKKKKKI